MTLKPVNIGTRGSQLALWQANWVREELLRNHPGLAVNLEIIKTTGDKITNVPLAKVGGKGLFVKEIEEALLSERIDLAVHSMKDMPGEVPEGLWISAIPQREIPFDVLVARDGRELDRLPPGAKIATGSLRRASQLLHYRPDLEILPIRGNIDTRMRKLSSGDLDAIILAAAGIRRLNMADRITQQISPEILLPAVGQGALCIETRENDPEINRLVKSLNDPPTAWAVTAERGFLKRLQGGCQVPIAAYGTIAGETLTLTGMVAETDGSIIYRDTVTGPIEQAEDLGIRLAGRLVESGAGAIIERLLKTL